jgi:hypothetical protein
MRKLILGMGAMALVASAATFAGDEDNTRVAAADSPAAAFAKLDADVDGRISAIEAANNSKVAAGFTTADADKDGYLSKAEYAQMAKTSSSTGAASSRSSTPSAEPSVPSDTSETAPAPK